MAIERVWLLDSNDSLLNSDYDFSAFELRLTDNTWGVLFDDVDIKTEFDLSWTSGDVTITAWSAIIVATRATSTPITNKKIAVRYQLSDTKTLTGTGTKIYIELDQTLIDDPTLIEDTYPSIDYAQGKNIWTMVRGTERPTTNPHIKLWEYDWAWNDLREYPEIDGRKIDNNVVKLTGDQTVAGVKTFSSSPIVPTPTTNYQASTKKYVDDEISEAWDQYKLTNSDFMTGEDLVEWDSIFLEESITFADANQEQNIWDVAGNTRVSTRVIWSWIAWNSLKLSLAKVVSPSVDLWIRIETDNAGEPSWTLVDANATATVTAASLTTSLADTTITLTDTITIAKGTVVHIVLFQWTYGSETVNGTNHYKIGYDVKNSSIKTRKLWNWSSWEIITYSAVADSAAPFGTTNWYSNPITNYYHVVPKFDVMLKTVSSWWTMNWWLYTNITSTTPNIKLVWWATYTFSKSWTSGNGEISVTANNVTITYDSWDMFFSFDITTEKIDTALVYLSSDLFADTLYSKTDASYTYKLPDIPRIVDKAYSAGEIPKRDFKGISKHLTGLTKSTELFVSDTPWALSTIAGTNSCILWKVINTDEVLLNRKVQSLPITLWSSPFTWTNETNNPVQIKITGGTVNPIVIDWVTVATATNHINTVPAWKSIVITYSSAPTVVYSDI